MPWQRCFVLLIGFVAWLHKEEDQLLTELNFLKRENPRRNPARYSDYPPGKTSNTWEEKGEEEVDNQYILLRV